MPHLYAKIGEAMIDVISHDVRNVVINNLRLKRKGDMVQLIWTDKHEDTVLSEVSIRDIKNQKVGEIYNGSKK